MGSDARKRAERDLAKLEKKWRREERAAKFRRLLGKKPMQYKKIPAPDWDSRTKMLSAFRTAYSDFFKESAYRENSPLQEVSTQMFWHRLYLQKMRMKRLGVTMDMESERVRRTKNPEDSIYENSFFDGRYAEDEINEAIWSKRTFYQNGRNIGSFRDRDSVNYTVLSAKQQGEGEIICPGCGNVTTRENLIDGCDFCKTKFTVEDLENKVCGFGFHIENAKEGMMEKARDAKMYFDESAGNMVRKFDPNFSYQSFKSNIYNKMAAIHFADSFRQVSAFSDEDLSALTEKYKDVVNIDFDGLILFDDSILVKDGIKEKNNYYVEDGMQKIKCVVHMVLFSLVDGKIKLCNDTVKLELEKSEDCKTQNICAPSVLKCKGCGESLSLTDGKACSYCGKELDMKQFDWVITKYESAMSEYGKSWRTYN